MSRSMVRSMVRSSGGPNGPKKLVSPSRRRFLRGVTGSTLAIPFLEYFAPARAHGSDVPQRYAFLFAGFSIGSYGPDYLAPAAEGPWNGTVTRALTPLTDQVAANVIGQGTLAPVLAYRAQPSFYRVNSEGTTDGIISARMNGAGELEQVPPVTSPRVAFESLFSGFIPPRSGRSLGGTPTARHA